MSSSEEMASGQGWVGWWQPHSHAVRFSTFLAVGCCGLCTQLAVTALLYGHFHVTLWLGAALAIQAAILVNFTLNSLITWRDRTRPRARWHRFLRYEGVNLVGLGINEGVLLAVASVVGIHYLLAILCGAAAASVWNYVANGRFTFPSGELRSHPASPVVVLRASGAGQDNSAHLPRRRARASLAATAGAGAWGRHAPLVTHLDTALRAPAFVGAPGSSGSSSPWEACGPAGVLRLLGALVWIYWAMRLYAYVGVVPYAGFGSVALLVGGVLLLVVSFLPAARHRPTLLDAVILGGTLAGFALWSLALISRTPSYGTDEVAFSQASAQLLLAGHDPYGPSLAWALTTFHVNPTFITNTLTGGFVHSASYPALSFLLYVPLLALGITNQAANYVDGLFWVLAMLSLWLALPRPWRPAVPILAGATFMTGYVLGGVIDALFLPFAIAGLWRWDRFGDPTERGTARWLGPVGLGLACAVEQSMWFVPPFIALGLFLEARRRGAGGFAVVSRYAALLAATFLLPNLPFIVMNPHTWFQGTLLPLIHPLVPFGQGLIALTLYYGIGGGHLSYFTDAGILVGAGLLALAAARYHQLKPVLPFLPAILLLFPARSLSNYFLFLVPALLVSMATVVPWPSTARALTGKWIPVTALAAALAFAGGGAFLGAALLTAPPLRVHIVSSGTNGSQQSVDTVSVLVSNNAAIAESPHFAVAIGNYMSSFWIVLSGPKSVPGHETARYQLRAPNEGSMPTLDQGLTLYTVTDQPPSIVVVREAAPTPLLTVISPDTLAHPLSHRSTLRVSVSLINQSGGRVHRRGIRVVLGQVIYAQSGLAPGSLSIDGQKQGAGATVATNADGVANFFLRWPAGSPGPGPTSIQAWIPAPVPHGYSATLPIWLTN